MRSAWRLCRIATLAEALGLSVALDRLINEKSCECIRSLKVGGDRPGPVSISVSGRSLLEAGFSDDLHTMLERHHVRAADLALEVSGTALLGQDCDRIASVLTSLHEGGFALILSDVGSGLAALAPMAHLPLSAFQLDRNFLGALRQGAKPALIAHAMIRLAKDIGIQSVGDGARTDDDIARLFDAGCDLVHLPLLAAPLLSRAHIVTYLQRPEPVAPVTAGVAPKVL